MDEHGFTQLLAAIYRAPGDAAAWSAAAGQAAHALGAAHAHVVAFTGTRVDAHAVTLPEAGQEYVDHYAARDRAVHRMLRGPDHRAVAPADLLTADELRRCPVRHELLPRYDGAHRLFVKSRLSGAQAIATAIIRAPGQGEFDAPARLLIERIHPHLAQAMRLHLELVRARMVSGALERGLDQLGTGLILLDRAGVIVFANAAAHAVLDARRGLGVELGRLAADSPPANARLQAAIGGARAGAPRQAVVLDGADGRPVIVRVLPAPPEGGWLAEGVVVLLNDTSAPLAVAPQAMTALGLTPAESRLAAALVGGATVAAYAREAGLAPSTVRSMLRDVFAKTGTHRQAELALLAVRVGVS